jgi:lysyl-tRNA synthetase class 2
MGSSIEILKKRAKIISLIRSFFDGRGFVEVETPVRIAAPAPEPNIDCPEVAPARNCAGEVTYLRASPELQMKKLLAAGMDCIYQIGPCFRDGEKGSRHNPEFTMIEWYRKGSTYIDILNDTKSLFSFLVEAVKDLPAEKNIQSKPISSLSALDFRNITVREAYLNWAGWDPCKEWDQDRFDFDMATKIEPALKSLGYVFLMDYPAQAASLARLRGDVAERWEFYAYGMELANCFTELCDPVEQRRRFAEAREERLKLNEADYPIDEEFLSVLGHIRSASGVALGVDRLVMTLLGIGDISLVRS